VPHLVLGEGQTSSCPPSDRRRSAAMRSPIAHMGRWWWVELTVVVSIVLMAIVVYRNPTISYDEPFHILAAQSTLRGEGLDVGGHTPYVRAWIYTYLVAGSIALFGDSLTAVRLPS